jgi:hypothetical protein
VLEAGSGILINPSIPEAIELLKSFERLVEEDEEKLSKDLKTENLD